MTDSRQITGIVLAGGRGTRMGGVDKGLQLHRGQPLAQHALLRLQPQVRCAMLNANRNLDLYEAMGVPVWPDRLRDHPGPLAGVLTGLEQCRTPWLVTAPCDVPDFPMDLVQRLAQAADAAGSPLAFAATREAGQIRAQPVFALLHTRLRQSLGDYLEFGQRRVLPWMQQHGAVEVVFDEAAAFSNANTLDDLRRLSAR
jgi:molybdopterin-guanine dinucleotide biosynthesis protein A